MVEGFVLGWNQALSCLETVWRECEGGELTYPARHEA